MPKPRNDKSVVSTEELLQICKTLFAAQKNPVYLLEAFLIAHRAHKTPPKWVLDNMAPIFEKFYESEGTGDLNRLFGFTPGKGQEPPFKRLLQDDRDFILALDMFLLHCCIGVSLRKAASMIQKRSETNPSFNWMFNIQRRIDRESGLHRSRHNVKPLSADTIHYRYTKKWKKILEQESMKKEILKIFPPQRRQQYLKLFPEHSFPLSRTELLKIFLPL